MNHVAVLRKKKSEIARVFGKYSYIFCGNALAENSTPLWSHHSILRSDETWLPEWSGNLGGV
jgi:hypothetical protein